LTLAGLYALLQTSVDITIVGQISALDHRQAITDLQPLTILLVDIDQPTGPDLSMLARLRYSYPTLPLAVSTLFADYVLLRTLIAYPIQAYLTKDLSAEQFLSALFIIAAGGTFFSQAAIAQLQPMARNDKTDCPTARLTLREQDLFHLLCQGASFRTIAQQLHLREQTVRNYASVLYEKLAVRSKGELIAQYGQRVENEWECSKKV